MAAEVESCVAPTVAPVTGIIVGDIADQGCVPHTKWWDNEGRRVLYAYAEAAPMSFPQYYTGNIFRRDLEAGDIHCTDVSRISHETADRCVALLRHTDINTEKLFLFNPVLGGDCSNIKYNTPYCTGGYLEPLRAHDGLCGPPHNFATCWGTDRGDCCNSETWKCGDSDHDCEDGICYEGMCWGHKYYTTDGTCGSQNGESKCTGKWGDCCNKDGKCGTGPDFCDAERCYSGNCQGQEKVNDED